MKIGILSDTHFGFAQGTERENDALFQSQQALEAILKEKVDFVLLAGDLFDSNQPSPEAWKQSFSFFKLAQPIPNSLALERENRSGEKQKIEWNCLPIVSIHGTHEYRPKDFVNALEVLEKSGFLVHLHAQKLFLRKGKEIVVVHGLSGVPEKVALNALKQWNPRPEKNCHNIFVLHQSITDFLPTKDEMAATISLSDFPRGFDLLVNGHLHWPKVHETPGGKFLLTGSTICTQIKKLEAEHPKGYWIYNTISKKLDFREILRQRKMFYKKMVFENATRESVQEKINLFFEGIFKQSFELKPLVRVKLGGTLQRGLEPKALNLAGLLAPWKEKCLLSFEENFASASLQQKIAELRKLQKSKTSITSHGMALLEKELEKTAFNKAFDVHLIFEWLEYGEIDKVIEALTQSKKESNP
ncbi:DNA repair exonuclease [Candidatus Micrarchaeota archaeon]|nr:DNA repair exonuclease [Candidatus Micrarchaeota archaeon]MBU1929895.1 DNA repair exonuclease [Candidatus Micrarchaeota archaeon]